MSCNTKSRYEETRKRFSNHFNMSDKEITEYLAEEIEYYRNKIRKLEKCNSEEHNIKVIDEDIQEEEEINVFANGKLKQTIVTYKYKENQ